MVVLTVVLQTGKVAQYYVRHGGFWVDLVASEWRVINVQRGVDWLHTHNPQEALACSLWVDLVGSELDGYCTVTAVARLLPRGQPCRCRAFQGLPSTHMGGTLHMNDDASGPT